MPVVDPFTYLEDQFVYEFVAILECLPCAISPSVSITGFVGLQVSVAYGLVVWHPPPHLQALETLPMDVSVAVSEYDAGLRCPRHNVANLHVSRPGRQALSRLSASRL